MYTLITEHSFDSAHFLAGYKGKCSNIHGHRWRVLVEVSSEQVVQVGQTRGMIVDFGDLKRDVRALADSLDHALIVEEQTMRSLTLEALKEDGFRIIEVPFRPTAENFSKYIYDEIKTLGYDIKKATVFETPNNCATYEE